MGLDWFKQWFKKPKAVKDVQQIENCPLDQIEMMLHILENWQDHPLSCEEAHHMLDQFAEVQLHGWDAAHLLPLVQEHLSRCPVCSEEHKALMRILNAHLEEK